MGGLFAFLLDLGIDTLGHLITFLLVSLLGYAVYLYKYAEERKMLLKFFGITNESLNENIYLSCMQIKAGGTTGCEEITVGYQGPSTSKLEFDAGILVQNLLKGITIPFLSKDTQDRLSEKNITLYPLFPEIKISPEYRKPITFENSILIGSPIYNSVSKYYIECQEHYFYFAKENGNRVIKAVENGFDYVIHPGRAEGRELGIIERYNDKEHGSVVFICAGIDASATFGCARYLVQHWKSLYKKYGTKKFGICLVFEDQVRGNDVVVNPKLFHSFSELENEHYE
jgi:hypothetical protein